jgi:ABC-type branched-subunit amino acid transport system ATPase component
MNEAAPTQPPVLSLEHVHRTFGGVVAIEDFSLDVLATKTTSRARIST